MGGFIIHQKPVRISPSNGEHVYTIESLNANDPAYADYKYVFDIWFFPYKSALREKKARIKVRPNSEGFAIIDVKEIIKNFVSSNIRLEYDDMNAQGITPKGYFGSSSSVNSSVTNIPLSQNSQWYFNCANAMNQTDNASNGFTDKFNIVEYRLMIGEEYLDTDGNIVTNISQWVINYEDSIQTLAYQIGSYPVQYPSVQWQFAFGTPTGVDISWYDSSETTLKGSFSSTNSSGVYETPTQPVVNDILYIESQYSGKKFKYIWVEDLESIIGWVFVEVTFPDDDYWSGKFSPPSMLIWLAADNDIQNDFYKSLLSVQEGIYTEPNIYANYNHLFDYTRYVFEVTGNPLEDEGYFLTDANKRYYDSSIGHYVNERTIYRNQPFIMGFLNGHLQEFSNELRLIAFRAYNSNGSTTVSALQNQVNRGGGPLTNFTDVYPSILAGGKFGNKLMHVNLNHLWNIFANSEYIDIWGICDINNVNPISYLYDDANTQIYRYKVKDTDCFNTPQYFVFLNSNGAWDSFTFGKKSQKVYEVNRSSYDKSAGKDSTQYVRRAEDMKNVVFDTEIKVLVEAFTDYLDEYDSKIVEDLLRSPEVYLVQEASPYNSEVKNTHLMPIKINKKSVEEYQKKYKRLFQHSIQFEYNSIKGYNSAI